MKRPIVKYTFFVVSSILIVFYALYISQAVMKSNGGYTQKGTYLFSDFCHHYIISCGLRRYEAKDLYTPEVLEAVKIQVLGPAPNEALKNTLALLYPPYYLFLNSILGSFSYLTAYMILSLSSLLLCLFAGSKIFKNIYMAVGLLSFPATFICLIYGQTGLMVSAFLTLSLFYCDDGPLLSGSFLTLALIKPQFCIPIFISYLAGRNFKALAATGATAVFVFIASVLAFGIDSWKNFLQGMERITSFSKIPFGRPDALSYESMYTIYSSMMRHGFSYAAAYTTQIILSAMLFLFIYHVWRHSDSKPLKMAATLISIPFCTHFGYYYDLVIVYFAMLCFFKFKQSTTADISGSEYVVIVSLYISIFLGIFDSAKAASQLLTPVAALAFVCLLFYALRRGNMQTKTDQVLPG